MTRVAACLRTESGTLDAQRAKATDGMSAVPSAAAKECRTWPNIGRIEPAEKGVQREERAQGGLPVAILHPGVAMRCFPIFSILRAVDPAAKAPCLGRRDRY